MQLSARMPMGLRAQQKLAIHIPRTHSLTPAYTDVHSYWGRKWTLDMTYNTHNPTSGIKTAPESEYTARRNDQERWPPGQEGPATPFPFKSLRQILLISLQNSSSETEFVFFSHSIWSCLIGNRSLCMSRLSK